LGRRGQAGQGSCSSLAGVPEELAREALRLAGHKLPVKTKFVKREGAGAVKAAEVHNLKDERAGGET